MAVITISRQFGAGGHTLGLQIAKRLNYQVIDKELIAQVAKEADVSVRWVEAVERETGGLLMRLVNKLVSSSFIERITGDSASDFDDTKYHHFMTKVIKDMAKEGNIVFIGRGAQFVLAGYPHAIKVLLVGKMEDRIKFMMEFYELNQTKAEQLIQREEKRRLTFLKRFYAGNPDEPGHYDLVLNMSRVSLAEAENLIVDIVCRQVDEYSLPIW